MNKNLEKKENAFDADEILQPEKVNESNSSNNEEVELKPIKYYKTYELNEEGLRLYGKYKKQQHLNMIKWSLLGTSLGCLFAAIIDLSLQKKIRFRSKDIAKTIVLLGCISIFTFHGIQASTIHLRAQQRELSSLYGKEVDEEES